MKRSCGVLLPVSCLPGPFGIGCFGPEALEFVERAASGGISWWQVLPFSPTGAGDSPYQSTSAFAGNPYFIDPRPLTESGWLTKTELASAIWHGDPSQIDYGWLYGHRLALLSTAAGRLDAGSRGDVDRFAAAHPWLDRYALFMAIKQRHGGLPWWEWPDRTLRFAEPDATSRFAHDPAHRDMIDAYRFMQYTFFSQWRILKDAAAERGIAVIGDMPIYVAADSAEVWGDPHLFEMDHERRPLRVAGVPPDYFAADGQLWGNPLYRWDVLARDGYGWWIERIRAALPVYDQIRIDHFRGFESYWAVPAGAANARGGTWEKGPSMDLFRRVFDAFPDKPIIAEDLGDIDQAVRDFLRRTGLPGMKVMQFAFAPQDGSTDRPHRFCRNSVAYSGTHDNDTTLSWLRQLSRPEWALLRDYLGLDEDARQPDGAANPALRGVLRTLLTSVADLAVIPLHDLLGLDGRARLNRPGIAQGNWRFRVTQEQVESVDWSWLRRINRIAQRLPVVVEDEPTSSTARADEHELIASRPEPQIGQCADTED